MVWSPRPDGVDPDIGPTASIGVFMCPTQNAKLRLCSSVGRATDL